MEFWYFLFGVIALIAAWPALRCLVKRLILASKLCRLCKRNGYTLFKAHPLWLLGGKRGRRCDCYIETPSEVYAVKLFGMPRRMTVLVIRANGEYFIRRFIVLFSFGQGIRFPINGKPRPMPHFDFRFRYRNEWEIKTPHNVLLVHPVSMEIRRQPERSGEVILGAGDTVNGMEIHSLPDLLGALEKTL